MKHHHSPCSPQWFSTAILAALLALNISATAWAEEPGSSVWQRLGAELE